MEDKLGGFVKVFEIFYKKDIGIEYMYVFVGKFSD